MKLSAEEQSVMNYILAAMKGIQDWGLSCNQGELAQAVHGMQLFVLMHAVHRETPTEWSNWYE